MIREYLFSNNVYYKQIFSTSAGLNTGKEGPFVHLACSAGNIACRLFPKFNKNESKYMIFG